MARPLLLDSNLAVLLVVGLTSRDYISKLKRLSAYEDADFDAILGLISLSDYLLFCPNVLTETSNLLRHINDPMKSEIGRTFAKVITRTTESVVSSAVASAHVDQVRLGLTDSVLLTLASQGAALLTVDLDLYIAAVRAGHEAINYNHIRDARLQQ